LGFSLTIGLVAAFLRLGRQVLAAIRIEDMDPPQVEPELELLVLLGPARGVEAGRHLHAVLRGHLNAAAVLRQLLEVLGARPLALQP